jgi:hypothetical protein
MSIARTIRMDAFSSRRHRDNMAERRRPVEQYVKRVEKQQKLHR